jgi:hypothetical protein
VSYLSFKKVKEKEHKAFLDEQHLLSLGIGPDLEPSPLGTVVVW